jgi:hypothetical protein
MSIQFACPACAHPLSVKQATARLRACSGDGAMRSSVSYNSAIRRQSVSAKVGARQCSVWPDDLDAR